MRDRYIDAKKNHGVHLSAHTEFSAGFKKEVLAEIKESIDRWNNDSANNKNPYSEPEKRKISLDYEEQVQHTNENMLKIRVCRTLRGPWNSV